MDKITITSDSQHIGEFAFVVYDSIDDVPYYIAIDWDGLTKAINICRDDDGYQPYEDFVLCQTGEDRSKFTPMKKDKTDAYYEVYVILADLVK